MHQGACSTNIYGDSANHQAMIIEYHQYSSVHSSDLDCQGSCFQRASIRIRVTDPTEASTQKIMILESHTSPGKLNRALR